MRKRALGLVVLSLVVSAVMWWPMLAAYPHLADGDGRYFEHQWEAGKAAIRLYHEFPLWNPFDCRGVPMWDHPESLAASPILLLATPLSPVATLWVWSIVHCAMGFLSMWLLARRDVKLGRTGSLLAAGLWAFAVSHTSQYAGAHLSLVDFWLAPLLIYLWRRAERDVSAAVKLGLVIAFMVYEGATYPLPFTILIVALETLTRVYPLRRLRKIVVAGVVTSIVAIGASAARLLPLADELLSKKRGNMDPDVDMLARFLTLRQMFLWRQPRWWPHLPHQQYVWGEYIAYLGGVLLVLAAIGFWMSVTQRRWLVALAAMTTALMLGTYASFAPWHLLHQHVPPFTSMRVPSRFRLLLQIPIALWIAMAIERLPSFVEHWVQKRRPRLANTARLVLIGVIVAGVVDPLTLAMEIIARMHHAEPAQQVTASPRFYYGGEGLAAWIDQPRQNRSHLLCRSFEWPALQDAPVWVGDLPQVRAKPDIFQTVSVSNVVRTQNTFSFDVDARLPGRVLLNSAYARGWRSSVGNVVNDHTLLAIEVPQGRYRVYARYWPRLLTPGIAITATTFVGLFALYLSRSKRVRRGWRRLRSR